MLGHSSCTRTIQIDPVEVCRVRLQLGDIASRASSEVRSGVICVRDETNVCGSFNANIEIFYLQGQHVFTRSKISTTWKLELHNLVFRECNWSKVARRLHTVQQPRGVVGKASVWGNA